MVATNMMSRSEFLSKNNEHIRYPNLFSTKFLLCVKLIAWIWVKEAECPNISMYSDLTRYSLIFLSERFLSVSFSLTKVSWSVIILSSSCLDLVYPILLMRALRSLERWAVAMIFIIYIQTHKFWKFNLKTPSASQ